MWTGNYCWRISSLLLLTTLIAAHPPASGDEPDEDKPAAGKEPAKDSPYAKFRSWKPVNPEPKWAIGSSLRDCRAPLPEEVKNPHADGFINVYVNDAGRETYLKKNAQAFAEGTVIVKEKLAKKDSKDATELGVMIKREKGFAPKSGDWQFIFVDAKGTVTDQQSKLENCASCHRLREKGDFVFRKVLAEAAKEPAKNVDSPANPNVRRNSRTER
jgi:hypothetical protein